MQNFNSYLILHNFRRSAPSLWIFFLFFAGSFTSLFSQNKIVYHGRDKQKDSILISTGDKYYDSGGPGGSRLPEQPGNYFNCNDPFNESTNCSSIYTFCTATYDTVALSFNDYLIVTGDRFKIFSGTNTSGSILFNSQTQGVSINGMRLTTGSLIKSKAINGCITVEMFASTIGNSIGWDADFIIFKQNSIEDACVPICKDNVNIFLPADTCYQKILTSQIISNFQNACRHSVKLFYPIGTDDLNSQAVNMSHAGKRFLFQVLDSIGSACVGYIKVNESLFQMADCTTDTLSCLEWENNLADLKKVSACSGKGYTVISTKFTAFDCESAIIGLVVRDLTILGDSSTVETCLDSIYIKRVSIDTFQKPGDIKLNCTDMNLIPGIWTPAFLLEKFDLDHDFKLDGYGIQIIPLFGGQPFKNTSGFCSAELKYLDLIIPGCGAAFKIRRQWILATSCSLVDSVFIQYISLEDNQPPIVGARLALNYNIPVGNCTAPVTIDSILGIKDCGGINQKVEISYPDPQDPSKQIVINNKLPISLSLPAGAYSLKFTFTDPCFNVTQQIQCLWISKSPDLQLTGDSVIAKSVDANSCFSRVYAKDFESYAKTSCKEKVHLAIAHADSVSYYNSYWKNKLLASCEGQDNLLLNEADYNHYIENWINTNVYSDYIDIQPCDFQKISLKAFSISEIPVKDASFNCSIHKWIAYHTDVLYRVYHNSSNKCGPAYPLVCLTEIHLLKKSDKNAFNYSSSSFLNDSTCKSKFLINEFEQIKLSAVSAHLFIKATDTLFQPIPTLTDIIYFENDQDKNECCDQMNCNSQIFAPNSWPGRLACKTCDSSDFIRNFSGPVHSSAVYTASGHYTYPSCNEYDSIRFFKPIYCVEFINTGKSVAISTDSLFYNVVLNGTSANQKTIPIRVNCANYWQLIFSDSIHQAKDCQPDTIIRNWSLSGLCNQTFKFKQKLIIKRRADFEVLFPKDVLIDCSAKLISDSAELWKRFGYPIVNSSSSDCIEITYKDSLLSTNKIDYCLLTQRVWKIVDLAHYDQEKNKSDYIINDTSVADKSTRYCVYRNLKDGGDGIIYYKQIITYVDLLTPVFSLNDTIVNGSNCMAPSFDIKIKVTDDCTPEEVLFSFHSLDLNSNGTYDRNYPKENGTVHFNEGLPPGIHRFRSISTDLCGNTDTTFTNITITDDGAPMALCVQSSVLIPIPSIKSIKILAKDFDAGSLAGCEKGPLYFSFSENILDSSRVYTCDSIGDKTLSVFITNTSRNQSLCSIRLQIVSDSVCNPSANIISINGNVMNPNKAGINKVDIKTNALLMKTTTNEQGVYQLQSLIPGQNITLVPDKRDDPLNGISAVDLLIIERHIKGLSLITDPYQLIAADVNRSGSVTITDLIELRKMILGTISIFSNNKDWIFIPASFKFNDPLAPWIYPETISYNPVTNSLSDVNFIGIKVGDVNNSSIINANQTEARNRPNSISLIHSVSMHNHFQLHSFYLPSSITGANAFQLSLNVPLGTSLHFDTENILQEKNGLHTSIHDNILKLVWTQPFGIELNTLHPLFTIKTNLPESSIDLSHSLNSLLFSESVMYGVNLSRSSVELQHTLQVFPNPSIYNINIRFYINDLQTEKGSLTNTFGKKFDHLIPALNQGWNHISLNKNELGGSGQYFFSIQGKQKRKSMMFIIL